MFGNSPLRDRATVGWTSCPSVNTQIVESKMDSLDGKMFPPYVLQCLLAHVIDLQEQESHAEPQRTRSFSP